MRRRRGLSRKLNNIIFFLLGMLVMVLVGIGVLEYKTNIVPSVSDGGYDENQYVVPNVQTSTEKWQEGDILYNGEYYRYNNYIRTYLLMGIDKDGPVETAKDGYDGGQSDAMFLIVIDDENQKLSVISINRNTMTDVDIYDENGKFLVTQESQICVQHGFGDGKKLSCTRSVDAVSNLFGNIPISGYIAINMGAIPILNDVIGGVEVQVLQDLSYPKVELKAGETRKLSGQEAYYYLRGRDTGEFDSATYRLRRQEQYILSYLNKLKKAAEEDASYVLGVYRSAEDYMVCSVDFASLAEEVMGYSLDDSMVYTVPGSTTTEGAYEAFRVDKSAMDDLIIDIFYVKVQN